MKLCFLWYSIKNKHVVSQQRKRRFISRGWKIRVIYLYKYTYSYRSNQALSLKAGSLKIRISQGSWSWWERHFWFWCWDARRSSATKYILAAVVCWKKQDHKVWRGSPASSRTIVHEGTFQQMKPWWDQQKDQFLNEKTISFLDWTFGCDLGTQNPLHRGSWSQEFIKKRRLPRAIRRKWIAAVMPFRRCLMRIGWECIEKIEKGRFSAARWDFIRLRPLITHNAHSEGIIGSCSSCGPVVTVAAVAVARELSAEAQPFSSLRRFSLVWNGLSNLGLIARIDRFWQEHLQSTLFISHV